VEYCGIAPESEALTEAIGRLEFTTNHWLEFGTESVTRKELKRSCPEVDTIPAATMPAVPLLFESVIVLVRKVVVVLVLE